MRIRHRFIALLAMGALAATGGTAQAAGDPDAGESKAGACAGCHGADGNASNPQWPNLAGQLEGYLYTQLKHYKSGARANAVMAGQAAGLSDQDMQDLAAYFATLEMQPDSADEELVDRGERIWRGGVAERDLPACSGCHGPAGSGMKGAGYPRLGAQNAGYLSAQLKAYRSGDRGGYENAGTMKAIASRMTDEDIEAVSSFASGLHRGDDQ